MTVVKKIYHFPSEVLQKLIRIEISDSRVTYKNWKGTMISFLILTVAMSYFITQFLVIGRVNRVDVTRTTYIPWTTMDQGFCDQYKSKNNRLECKELPEQR